jgi:Fe-S-cluster containining protein
MTDQLPSEPRTVTVEEDLTLKGGRLKFRVPVPADPVPIQAMLSLVRALTDGVVGGTVAAAANEGRRVSCRAGCGACCRQLVAVSEAEARAIRDLVEGLPEPRRSAVKGRFAAARQRLEEAGLLDRLRSLAGASNDEFYPLAKEYQRLWIDCPFLDAETGSIYEDRPLTCREYLVTTPAENCAQPTPATVARLPLPVRMGPAIGTFVPGPPRFVLPVPLALALEWAEAHPDEEPRRTGPEWVRELLDRLRLHGGESPPG